MAGLLIIEFFASAIEAVIGIFINAKTLCEANIKYKETVFAACLVAGMIWIMNHVWLFSPVITAAGILGISVSSCVLYKIKIWDSVALSAVYLMLVYMIDFASLSLLGVMFENIRFAETVAEALSYERACFLIFDKILLGGVYYFLAKTCLIQIQISFRKVLIGLLLLGVLISVMVRQTFRQTNTLTAFSWFCFVLLILIAVYLFMQLISFVQRTEQIKMAAERNLMLADNYQKEIHRYQKERVFYHDLKNQHLIIEQYLNDGEFIKAKDYLKQLKDEPPASWAVRTGISALDVLLEFKLKEAEEKNIHTEVEADRIELNLTESEMVALFGNLLDNAIEACESMEMGMRWIHMAIRKQQEMTFIKISNSYGTEKKKKDNHIHGLGTVSMNMIVEKYEGTMNIEKSSDEYSVLISFFS